MSGSRDLVPLTEALHLLGKRVIIMSSKEMIAKELRNISSVDFVDVTTLQKELERPE